MAQGGAQRSSAILLARDSQSIVTRSTVTSDDLVESRLTGPSTKARRHRSDRRLSASGAPTASEEAAEFKMTTPKLRPLPRESTKCLGPCEPRQTGDRKRPRLK